MKLRALRKASYPEVSLSSLEVPSSTCWRNSPNNSLFQSWRKPQRVTKVGPFLNKWTSLLLKLIDGASRIFFFSWHSQWQGMRCRGACSDRPNTPWGNKLNYHLGHGRHQLPLPFQRVLSIHNAADDTNNGEASNSHQSLVHLEEQLQPFSLRLSITDTNDALI